MDVVGYPFGVTLCGEAERLRVLRGNRRGNSRRDHGLFVFSRDAGREGDRLADDLTDDLGGVAVAEQVRSGEPVSAAVVSCRVGDDRRGDIADVTGVDQTYPPVRC